MKKHIHRYSITPQMREYDQIKENWVPFVMFMQRPNYRSKIINTDNLGFRFNNLIDNSNSILDDANQKNIIIGNSLVFGVGSTKDDFTISSLLSKKSKKLYLNFGGRAFSGFQEIILFNQFMNKLKNLDEIIIISGINDFFLINQLDYFNYHESLIYNQNKFLYEMNKSKKNTISELLSIFSADSKFSIPTSNNEKEKVLKSNIERNLFFWNTIKLAFKIKIKFFLQPCATWCKKKLSSQEEKIFNELDKYHLGNKIQKFFSDQDHKVLSSIYEAYCKKYDIDYLDLNDQFFNFDEKKNWLFVDRVHLTDEGYEKVADIILKS